MTQQTYTPNWSKAPNDANWHARDSDGCGFWYNKRPAPSRGFWAAGCSLTIADNDCPVLDRDAALDNWRDTLTVRPFQDRDIPQNLSDYFSGKTPFITAYVDLLLARMAATSSFSDDDDIISCFNSFDVITFEDKNGERKNFAVVLHASLNLNSHLLLTHNMAKKDGGWHRYSNECLRMREYGFRTITELEAVEFRAAMEAVYG